MNWFSGSIAEAVTYSQTQKVVFCVAILGTNEASLNLETLLAEPNVVSFISAREKFVCVRVSDGTADHQAFLQLYPNAKTPSIYCISLKGAVIEIIVTAADAADLRSKFEAAWTRHQLVISQGGQGQVPQSSTATPTPTSAPVAPSAAAGPSSTTGESATAPAQAESPKPPLEERIERAKKLAAAKAAKKAAEEAEAERRKEIERREAGKGAIEMRRWQEEEETRRLAEERRRDKKADALLKQKLREQIAQDRLDRQLRDNPLATATEPSKPADTAQSSSASAPPRPAAATANFSGQARLQFRLPTGASHVHSFDPDTKLEEVRQHLVTNAVVPFRDFTISVAFPRRQFTPEDYGSTLRDLGLLPSAALLILPIANDSMLQKAGSAGQGLVGTLTSLVGFMLYPLTLVLSFLQRFITPALPPAGPPPTTSAAAAAAAARAERNQAGSSSSFSSGGSGNVLGGRKRDNEKNSSSGSSGSGSKSAKDGGQSSSSSSNKKPKQSDHFGADGNVHRLRSGDSDSDDEQATWNGNSTQQM